MNYNDGAVKDITTITDKRKAAHDFAEGNIYLEELLNNCYDREMITVACCAGHRGTRCDAANKPYIVFKITKENEIYIYNMLNRLLEKGYKFELSSSSGKFPAFILRCNLNQDYNQFFKDINDVIIKSKQINTKREDLDKIFQIILNILLSNNNFFDFGIVKNNDKYNFTMSFNGFYELVSLDKEGIFHYINDIIKKKNITYQENIEFSKYNPMLEQEKEWMKFQEFLKQKNIKLKGDPDHKIFSNNGAYSSDYSVKCELEVDENDTICSVTEKLNDLLLFRVYAKAIINGQEVTNSDYVKSGQINGRDIYQSNYSVVFCIKKYEKIILDRLNKEYFNNELLVLEEGPFSIISFNNPNLSEEELINRIMILKENKLDIIIKYKNLNRGIGKLSTNDELSYQNLNNNILLSMCGITNVELLIRLLDLYKHVSNITTKEQLKNAFEAYKFLMGDKQLEINRKGKLNYIQELYTNRFCSLMELCLHSRIIPIINFFKNKFSNSEYLDQLINNLKSYELTEEELLKIIGDFFIFFDQHYYELDEETRKVV